MEGNNRMILMSEELFSAMVDKAGATVEWGDPVSQENLLRLRRRVYAPTVIRSEETGSSQETEEVPDSSDQPSGLNPTHGDVSDGNSDDAPLAELTDGELLALAVAESETGDSVGAASANRAEGRSPRRGRVAREDG